MKRITSEFFTEIISQSNKLIVIVFWAEWCGPCTVLTPILEQLEKEFPEVEFFKCGIEENESLVSIHNIKAIPYLAFFKNGNKIHELIGNQSKVYLAEAIEKHR